MPIDNTIGVPLECANMKVFRLFLITTFVVCPTVLRADIYRFIDKDGVAHFTNTPGNAKAQLYLREAPKPRPPAKASRKAERWVFDYAERCSLANNLSPALVKAIIRAESNGFRLAVSPKGAQGMMQLMPFTAKRLNVSDPFDPIENIEGGVKYIKELLATFGGNVRQAVAAYNAGPAAVKKYGGVPPYDETRLYVRKVMTYYRQYQAGR